MEAIHNLFTHPALTGDSELFDTLAQGSGIRIERILSTGQATPDGEWCDQDTDEWVALLQGEAELRFYDGRTGQLAAGDYLFIPAHQRHRVERTSTSPPCIWLALHFDAGTLTPTDLQTEEHPDAEFR